MSAALLDLLARLCPVPEAVDPAAMAPLPEPRGPLFNTWVPDPELVEPPEPGFHTAPVAHRALTEPRWRRARLYGLSALPPPRPDLGRARPRAFRVDEEFRTAAERERPPTLADRAPRERRPPPPAARLRPPSDPGRARPERFRLDAELTTPAERIGPAPRAPVRRVGFPEPFWKQLVDPGRTLYGAPPFPAPASAAWAQTFQARVEAETFGGNPEGLYPYEYEKASAVEDALEEVKEQFFLRRDVERPEMGEDEMEVSLEIEEIGRPMLEKFAPEIIPPVTFEEWVKLDLPLAAALPPGPVPSGEALDLLRTLQQALAEDPPRR